MNKLLKRGFNVYKILLKNKLAASLMMLVSGTMMAIAALNGHGNDTKTLPILLTSAGIIFAFWSFYRLGYIKANYDKIEDKLQKNLEKRIFFLQILEAIAYFIVTAAGIFLLINENFMNLILNLVVGGFTIFNGIMGIINLYKRREKKDYRWIIRLVLTIVELVVGTYFLITLNTIAVKDLLVMGILTAVAGLIEVIAVSSKETLKDTVEDGKEIVRTLKS